MIKNTFPHCLCDILFRMGHKVMYWIQKYVCRLLTPIEKYMMKLKQLLTYVIIFESTQRLETINYS